VPAGSITGAKRHSRSDACRQLILGVVAVVVIPSLAQVSRNFPGPKSELTSPNGRYVIQNVDHNEEYKHFLFLKDKATGTSRQVYEYGRSASVVWSPDSLHLAINDYAGSNVAETYIFSIDETVPKINVRDELVHKGKVVPPGGHDYFGVARWLDGQRVVVHFWGHSDDSSARAICQCYIYTLGGPVVRCAHQPNGNDPEELCGSITP
jgi:hypothetical protein